MVSRALGAPVKRLYDHPLFVGVSRSAMDRLAERVQVRRYAAGDVILRAGDASTELHGLVTGAAHVELPGLGGRRVVLAPPQSFGEMSAISGASVSATVVAQRDTETWVVTGSDLYSILAEEPAFYRNVSVMLGERLRHRTRDPAETLRPMVTVILVEATECQPELVLQGLYAGVRHYEPVFVGLDARMLDTQALTQKIVQWRNEGNAWQILMVLIRMDQLDAIGALLEPSDLVLWVASGRDGPKPIPSVAVVGEIAMVRLGARTAAASGERWAHALDAATFASAAQHAGSWSRSKWPELDRVVRQICCREIGLALSVGAAAGLAHLGLLEVLEDASVPLDFLCGSSMGGAVSMAYAYFGNARAAGDAVCRLSTDFARSKGLQWLPRAGLISSARMNAICGELFGRTEFSELRMPAAVVAADLVASRRVVLDSGSVAIAARATTAIPGLFPPVRLGNSVLVDGGLVTRVPADLLARRRVGLRLAGVVEPEKSVDGTLRRTVADALEASLERPFGLRTALGASWSLLGWWDSAAQAQRADVVVRIPTPYSEGYNFLAGKALIDYGRHAAESHLSAIQAAARRALSPGAP